MSIYVVESFDGVASTTQMGTPPPGGRWSWFNTPTLMSLSSTNARTGNNMEVGHLNANLALPLSPTSMNDINAQNKEIYFGVAYRTPNLPSTDFRGIIGIQDANGVGMNCLCININGSLTQRRETTNFNTTGAGTITTNTWYYIENYIKRADSGGRWITRVNDLVVMDSTGDTFSGGSNNPWLGLGWMYNSGNTHLNQAIVGAKYDDLYVVTVDGTGHNGFCGTSYVPCLRPNGNGVTNQWVGSDGNSTDNHLLLDEQSINDLDYVEATTNGERDLYQHETYDVPVGQTILSVQQNVRASYLVAGTPRDIGYVARLQDGTTEVIERPLSNSITLRWLNRETKPGGGAWSETDFNDAEFGYEQAAV